MLDQGRGPRIFIIISLPLLGSAFYSLDQELVDKLFSTRYEFSSSTDSKEDNIGGDHHENYAHRYCA